jgi:hypothetical protein
MEKNYDELCTPENRCLVCSFPGNWFGQEDMDCYEKFKRRGREKAIKICGKRQLKRIENEKCK